MTAEMMAIECHNLVRVCKRQGLSEDEAMESVNTFLSSHGVGIIPAGIEADESLRRTYQLCRR